MSKTFAQAPKPKALTDEAIAAFERSGAGQDTHAHKPTLPQTREPSKPETLESADVASPKGSNVEKHKPTDVQTHISANVETNKPADVGEEPTRRLSIDLPESLHRRFKTACSRTDRKMLVEVSEFIKRRVEELERL